MDCNLMYSTVDDVGNILSSCRFCMDLGAEVFIDDNIRAIFQEVTSIEVSLFIRSNLHFLIFLLKFQLILCLNYSMYSCIKCIEKLNNIVVTRREFIEAQNTLYSRHPPVKIEKEEPHMTPTENNTNFEIVHYSDSPDEIAEQIIIRKPKKLKSKSHSQIEKVKQEKRDSKKVSKSKLTVPCPDCGITLKLGSLRKHQKNMHLKQKNFICDHCGRAFFLKTRLLNHLRR